MKTRVLLSITFDDDDAETIREELGLDESDDVDFGDYVNGCMDNMSCGSSWIEQVFEDGKPTVGYLSGGIKVTISDHDID